MFCSVLFSTVSVVGFGSVHRSSATAQGGRHGELPRLSIEAKSHGDREAQAHRGYTGD